MIKFPCPGCKKQLGVADVHAGKKVQCPACQTINIAPAEAEVEELVELPEEEAVERPKKKKRSRDEDEEEDDRPRKRRRSRRSRAGSYGGIDFSLSEMVPLAYELQVNIGIGLGLLLSIIGVAMLVGKKDAGVAFIVLADIFWIWGCCAYCKNKNQSEWLGMLGFFGLFGLIALVLLPDRN